MDHNWVEGKKVTWLEGYFCVLLVSLVISVTLGMSHLMTVITHFVTVRLGLISDGVLHFMTAMSHLMVVTLHLMMVMSCF